MPHEAPVPPEVVHVELGVELPASKASTGFWMLWPGLVAPDNVWAQFVTTDFVLNLLQYFLNVMHSDATVRVLRLSVGGSPPFRWVSLLAPNAGALTAGQAPAIAAGIYLQTTGGGRGSGTRIKVPAIGNEMTDSFVYLSDYGEQQLQFLATALGNWPALLGAGLYGTPVLGTLQRRKAGSYLDPAQFDPAIGIRPTFQLETTVKRQRATRGISPF